VNAGRQLAREGQPCHQFLIVMEGRLCTHSDDGARQTLRCGDSYGWSPMRERGVNDATVVAESDTRLLVMGHAQFRAAIAIASP
jgi:CRP-like cAMP-binding protein